MMTRRSLQQLQPWHGNHYAVHKTLMQPAMAVHEMMLLLEAHRALHDEATVTALNLSMACSQTPPSKTKSKPAGVHSHNGETMHHSELANVSV
jgi:hypothetical protein